MIWTYSAVIFFKGGNVKDVSGRVAAMNDRFSASIIVRSEIIKNHEGVEKVVIDTLTNEE